MTAYRVRDILRRDLPPLTPSLPIRRAAAVLVDSGVVAAPVVGDDGELAGILSQRDCFRPALLASYHRDWIGTVADHMTREVVSVEADDEVIGVAEMFMTHRHRVFAVLDGGAVAGIVDRSDVLALLMRLG